MDGKARLQCRLWWPRHLKFRPFPHSYLLLGWASRNSHSVDLVVATACCTSTSTSTSTSSNVVTEFGSSDRFLQGMINFVSERLPSELQSQSAFSVIGECLLPHSEECLQNNIRYSGSASVNHKDKGGETIFCLEEVAENDHSCTVKKAKKVKQNTDVNGVIYTIRNGFRFFDEVKCKQSFKAISSSDIWIDVSIEQAQLSGNLFDWIPYIHNLTIQGRPCVPDFQLILYEQPKLSSHHFSVRPWSYVSEANNPREALTGKESSQVAISDWLTKLEKNRDTPDIDLVVLQLNCAVSAEQLVSSLDPPNKQPSLRCTLTPLYRHVVASTAALVSTFFYVFVQTGFFFLNVWPFIHINSLLSKLFKFTHRNVRIRCYELTGWPIILLWRGCGIGQPNIAAAHRTALVRHSTWSAVIFDMVFGIIAGTLFLYYQSDINNHIRSVVRTLTDDVLRTGCIWLMGVPAGFKLNTELAGMLGLVSLNMIQVWSTLLYFLKPMFGPSLCILAVSGMLFGITVPAALIADILFLATMHISMLHQLVAFLYSNQLQALAALWRLFRGRKRNTLRGRIDTYDYSVEQHVVGSLMFTPLLLLLPTTSVFYIFFTMLYTSLSITRFCLQFFIAILHCFPYAQVAMWLVHPRRFPSGIWFEIIPAEFEIHKLKYPRCAEHEQGKVTSPVHRQMVVTKLGVKVARLGELLFPFMKQLGGGLTWSSCAICVYKIFSGERWPSSVELGAPVLPPWTNISFRRFWWLCYDAVLVSFWD